MPQQGDAASLRQRRKRHHFLPMSYLAAWADDRGQVAVRRRDSSRSFCASTRRVAVEADLYSFESEAGVDDSLEVALSEVERPLRAHLEELREGRTPRKGTSLREEISYLVAIQLARTPEHLQRWTFPTVAADFTGESPISRDGMRRFLAERHLGVPPSESELQGALDFANIMLMQGAPTKEEAFELAFKVARDELTPRLAKRAWAVEISRQRSFFTTDRPIAVWKHGPRDLDSAGAGLGDADEVWFPLGPQHLLVLRPKFPEHRSVVPAGRVDQVNRHLAAACHEIVVAQSADQPILSKLNLRSHRPAIRFNSGPLLEEDTDGRLIPSGREILHSYVPYDDGTV